MKLTARETAIFGMLGAIMYVSKLLMEFLPNIHLIAVFTVAFTVVYRQKALYPIYTYVLLNGLFAGFSLWWMPYLYIWTLLWGITMLLPKNMPKRTQIFVYMGVCALHGFAFGILYAPAQTLMFGLNFKSTVAWVLAGFPFDCVQGIGNLVLGSLIIPIAELLKKIDKIKIGE